MSPARWIEKYGQNLSIEEIRENLKSSKDLSDTEIQDLINKARGVV